VPPNPPGDESPAPVAPPRQQQSNITIISIASPSSGGELQQHHHWNIIEEEEEIDIDLLQEFFFMQKLNKSTDINSSNIRSRRDTQSGIPAEAPAFKYHFHYRCHQQEFFYAKIK
jgi:hypothetical protein